MGTDKYTSLYWRQDGVCEQYAVFSAATGKRESEGLSRSSANTLAERMNEYQDDPVPDPSSE